MENKYNESDFVVISKLWVACIVLTSILISLMLGAFLDRGASKAAGFFFAMEFLILKTFYVLRGEILFWGYLIFLLIFSIISTLLIPWGQLLPETGSILYFLPIGIVEFILSYVIMKRIIGYCNQRNSSD